MSRAGLVRLRRNVAIALGNSHLPEAGSMFDESPLFDDESHDDPLVTDHVEWAQARFANRRRLSGDSEGTKS